MRLVVAAVFAALALTSWAQGTEQVWRDSSAAYWQRMDAEFADSATSPLKAEDRAHFQGLRRFPYDPRFHVTATFTPAKKQKTFKMTTTTDRRPLYKPYGEVAFTVDGRPFRLMVYQNLDLLKRPGFENYLFLPFTDLTSGEESYGGGRYLDLHGPLGATVELDLNNVYNPYCAYNSRYSCPIPPKENFLDLPVRAGVLKFHD